MKIINVCAILVMVFFISACIPGGVPVIKIEDIRKGTMAVAVEFIENSPRAEVYQKSNVPITIQLSNKGAFDIVRGSYSMKFFPGSMMLFKERGPGEPVGGNFEKLLGKSSANIGGGEGFIYETAESLELPSSTPLTEKLILNLCYPYRTIASATEVCIDTTLGEALGGATICTPRKVSLSGGQGGPIALDSVEIEMEPMGDDMVKPHVKLSISKSGEASIVHSEDATFFCEGRSDFRINDVTLSAKLGVRDLDCGSVRLSEDKATVRCTLERGLEKERGVYETVVEVTMNYGVNEIIRKDILIKQI